MGEESTDVRLARMEEQLKTVLKILNGANLPELAVSVRNHDRILWAIAAPALGGLGLGLWLVMRAHAG